MSLCKPVTHCIFDMDGLLLDTETIYEESVREICRSYGKDYPWDVRMKILGSTERKTAEIAIKELSLPLTVPEFLVKLEHLVEEEFKTVKLMKGVDRLIRHLHAHNISFCVASSSGKDLSAIKMSGHSELFKLFTHFVFGSTDAEVKNGKPAPDIFLLAARRFKDKPDPSKCLVFEDSVNGVKAGVAAGMQTVMVPDEKVSIEKRTEATIVLNTLEDFQPELFGLPKFTD